MSSIKLKAKAKDDLVQVKALIQHPMETGLRKDGDGKAIPPHYINKVVISAGDKEVATANWSGSISKNPYISVSYKGGKKGDTIKLSWTDNKDGSDSAEAKVK